MQAKIEILQKDEAKIHQGGVYPARNVTKYEGDRYLVEVKHNYLWELRKLKPAGMEGLVKVSYNVYDSELKPCYVHFKRCKPFQVIIRFEDFDQEKQEGWDDNYAIIPYDKFIRQVKYDDNLDSIYSREWLEENATTLLPGQTKYNNAMCGICFNYKENCAILQDYRQPLTKMDLTEDNVDSVYNRWMPEIIGDTLEVGKPANYVRYGKNIYGETAVTDEGMTNDDGTARGYFRGFEYRFVIDTGNIIGTTLQRSLIDGEIKWLLDHQERIPMLQRLKGLSAFGYDENGQVWHRNEHNKSWQATQNSNYIQDVMPFGYNGDSVSFTYDMREDVTYRGGGAGHNWYNVKIHMSVPIYAINSNKFVYGRWNDVEGELFADMTTAIAYGRNYYTLNKDYLDRFQYAINILDYEFTDERDGNYGPVYGYITSGVSNIDFGDNGFITPDDYTGNNPKERIIGVVLAGDLLPVIFAGYTNSDGVEYPDVGDLGRFFCIDWKPNLPDGIKEEIKEIQTDIENDFNDNQIIQYDGDDNGTLISCIADYKESIEVPGEIIGDPVRVSANSPIFPLSQEGEYFNGFIYKYIGSIASTGRSDERITTVISSNPSEYPWNGSVYSGSTRRWYVYEGLHRTVLKTYYPNLILDCSVQQSIGNSNSFAIGCVGGASATFEILKPIPELMEFKGYDCYVYFNYPLPLANNYRQYFKEGMFTIRDIEENGFNKTRVTAYDNAYKLDCKAWPLLVKLDPDTPLIKLFYYICAYCDIPYATEFFFTNNDMALGDISSGDRDITCRDVITGIAEISGNVMVCNENGVLVVKELEQPILSRGSGASENYSLTVSMVPVIKPEAIRYKISNSQITIGEEYTQWENRILDYTGNGLLSNHTEFEDTQRLNTLLNKIRQIQDIYAFECDIDNNIYSCVCGDSGVVEGNNIEARRGIITDRSISMSGVHLTSAAGIEAEYVPMAVSNIDDAIGSVDQTVFREIHVDYIYFIDNTTGNIYKSIYANYDFSILNTTFEYEDVSIDLSTQFDDLYINPSRKHEMFIGASKAEVWIENHILYINELDHISELFTNINDIVVEYYNGGTYNFSEKYADSWNQMKESITDKYSIPIEFTKNKERVNESAEVKTELDFNGFQLKHVLQMSKNTRRLLTLHVTEDGLQYYNDDAGYKISLTDDTNYPGEIALWYVTDNRTLYVEYLPNIIKPNDESDEMYVNGAPYLRATHNMASPNAVVLWYVQYAPGILKPDFIRTEPNTDYLLKTYPSHGPLDQNYGGYYECYGRGRDANVYPITLRNNNYGGMCYHAHGPYNDNIPNGGIFKSADGGKNYSVKNLRFDTGGPNHDEGGFMSGSIWGIDNNDPNASTYENYWDSPYYDNMAAVFVFKEFIELPIIHSIVFDLYTDYGIDTVNGNVGIHYNAEYFVPNGSFEIRIPSDTINTNLMLYYAPKKRFLDTVTFVGNQVSAQYGEVSYDPATYTLHYKSKSDVLDALLGI